MSRLHTLTLSRLHTHTPNFRRPAPRQTIFGLVGVGGAARRPQTWRRVCNEGAMGFRLGGNSRLSIAKPNANNYNLPMRLFGCGTTKYAILFTGDVPSPEFRLTESLVLTRPCPGSLLQLKLLKNGVRSVYCMQGIPCRCCGLDKTSIAPFGQIITAGAPMRAITVIPSATVIPLAYSRVYSLWFQVSDI